MDSLTVAWMFQSALVFVEKLRYDTQFDKFWDKFSQYSQTTDPSAAAPLQKQPRNLCHLSDYVVDTIVVGEIKARFNLRNIQLVQALCTLHPRSEDFLNTNKVRPLLDLTGTEMKEAEFAVAQQFQLDEIAKSNKNWTTQYILMRYCEPLAAIPTVLKKLKLSLTFGEQKRSMLHKRNSCLIQIVVEKDFTKKLTGEWKETLLRRFSTTSRWLQLFSGILWIKSWEPGTV
ncbi:unnamed protein product [Lepeophtheirus salmonis]|uniref:(salmon louse) hypothetical protein n=1 Tax=Lepeophtheirus salmonis TaxID=72036 RepID=A0A7R8CNC0_LEPSM|nr:unnamed protein product [Lepeophtheirus salmonis]CAF2873167.1 unnamed protein product [Lepeophtheirus salmonis]